MSVEDLVERALADHVRDVSPLPDVEALLTRGTRARRRRRAGVLASVLAAVVLIGVVAASPILWMGADSAPVTHDSAPATPTNVGADWGPDVPFWSAKGIPFAGSEKWPMVDSIASMTVVGGGIVYVLPDRRIIWESWQHKSAVIGNAPWYAVDPFDFAQDNPSAGWARGPIGDPGRDVVAWFETVNGQRGDLVIVRPSTGEELARTTVPGPPGARAGILAMNEEYVYFSAETAEGSRELGTRSVSMGSSWPLDEVWSWRWNSGDAPEATGRKVQDAEDVSAGVWAAYDDQEAKLQFETDTGRLLSNVPSHWGERATGRGLSPDGRYWFAQNGLLATATGQERSFGRNLGPRHWAWTGTSKFTVIGDGRTMVCDAQTMTCTKPDSLTAGNESEARPPTQ